MRRQQKHLHKQTWERNQLPIMFAGGLVTSSTAAPLPGSGSAPAQKVAHLLSVASLPSLVLPGSLQKKRQAQIPPSLLLWGGKEKKTYRIPKPTIS